jgi:hypothetical protein
MHHVAIMKKSWGLIPKILDGRKKIESRWGINKCSPWGRVKASDAIYFKNSGEPVIAVANVSKILQFEDLSSKKVKEILEKYGGDDGISISNLEDTIKWAKKKRYCTLIYLENPKRVKSFNIDKAGYGVGAAWLSVSNINKIKRPINRS